MRNYILAAMALMSLHIPADAIESEITVLAVTTGGANQQRAINQMRYLENQWSDFGGASLHLINAGVPIPLTATLYTGSTLQQLNSAVAHPEWGNYREAFAADVVLIFTGQVSETGTCGRAIQYNWTSILDTTPGSFVLDAGGSGLDTRGKNHSYYALIATGSANYCDTYEHIAAHEFAHLLGAGHTNHSETQGVYLYGDSHARATVVYHSDPIIGTIRLGTKTIVAEGRPPVCDATPTPVECLLLPEWSDNAGVTDNQRALSKTAMSVANYRIALPGGGADNPDWPGGPGCSLSAPTFVVGNLVNACIDAVETEHEISWAGGCPSLTTYYEVWGKQPAVGGSSSYSFGWSVSATSTPVFVGGADTRIKIKGCNASQCSSLSSDSYLASLDC